MVQKAMEECEAFIQTGQPFSYHVLQSLVSTGGE